MATRVERLRDARNKLDDAMKASEVCHATWSECVTSLHMAELELRKAQKAMRWSYNAVVDVLNGDAAETETPKVTE